MVVSSPGSRDVNVPTGISMSNRSSTPGVRMSSQSVSADTGVANLTCVTRTVSVHTP
jgi:hypothetical protein